MDYRNTYPHYKAELRFRKALENCEKEKHKPNDLDYCIECGKDILSENQPSTTNSLYQMLLEGKINERCPKCHSTEIGVVHDSDKENLVCQDCKHEFSLNQSLEMKNNV